MKPLNKGNENVVCACAESESEKILSEKANRVGCPCPKQECGFNNTIGCGVCGTSSCNCPKVEYVSTMDIKPTESDINTPKDCNAENLSIGDKRKGTVDPLCPKVESILTVSCVPDDESYGNDLAISTDHGLMGTTCLNLDSDAPWDVLNNDVYEDGNCVPFSNGGVTITDFSTGDIIIENPAVVIDIDQACEHGEHKDNEMRELSLEMFGDQANEHYNCCSSSRSKSDNLGCPCRRTTKIMIGEDCGKPSIYILQAQQENQERDSVSNRIHVDGSEIYSNTLYIDMDELEILNENSEPFCLPHDKNLDSSGGNNSHEIDQPDVGDELENSKQEIDPKQHIVYVCDEEDMEDVCRICHCGSEDEPLISP